MKRSAHRTCRFYLLTHRVGGAHETLRKCLKTNIWRVWTKLTRSSDTPVKSEVEMACVIFPPQIFYIHSQPGVSLVLKPSVQVKPSANRTTQRGQTARDMSLCVCTAELITAFGSLQAALFPAVSHGCLEYFCLLGKNFNLQDKKDKKNILILFESRTQPGALSLTATREIQF